MSEKRGSLGNAHADLCLRLGGIRDILHVHPTAWLPREFLLDATGPNDPPKQNTLYATRVMGTNVSTDIIYHRLVAPEHSGAVM